ncbi:MAG: hypothetical protein LC731_06140, partial [Acidobacteria bacterium]|nr:hypothetical protein [Acidobacteriota bacterium]
MKNFMLHPNSVEKKAMRNTKMMKRTIRISAVGALFAATAFLPFLSLHAQKQDAPKVTGISSRRTARGQVITITTDGPVSGTQTWQDPNGKFNLVLPGSGNSQVNGAPNGVGVRKLGNSLGIEVPTKPGANVTVQPRANGVDLIVEGEIDSSKPQPQTSAQTSSQSVASGTSSSYPGVAWSAPRSGSVKQQGASSTGASSPGVSTPGTAATAGTAPANTLAQNNNPTSATAAQPPAANTSTTSAPAQTAPPPAAAAPSEDEGIMSYIFSYTGLAVLLVLGLILALVLRRKQQGGWENIEEEKVEKAVQSAPVNMLDEETERTGERRKRERRK